MDTSAEKIWAKAQKVLRQQLNTEMYSLWFAPIRASKLEADAITLEVADEFCEVWLKENHLDLITKVLMQSSGQVLRIIFHPQETPAQPPGSRPASSKNKARGRTDSRSRSNSLPEIRFNSKNTFETFVVGENNSHAHAAAQAIAQNPGRAYNPLFVYSGVGLGKTHLLHAIGHFVTEKTKGARVAYVSSEKFTNEYIDALQNNQIIRFRRKYRQSDVLLIDDVQFLAGKERIQEEFFHTFNTLHEEHKQIVLTCDRPANEIQNLEHRLVSRFEWGLVTDIQPPDVETRLAILRKKQKTLCADLPDEILNFLANRIRTNIRRLEGALIRCTAYSSLEAGRKLTLEVVEDLLRDLLAEEGRTAVNIDLIQKRVAEHYDIRLADMTSRRRPENIAFPRQVAMFLARQMTGSSLNAIGEAFGGRDHGTVLHACRLVRDRMEVDATIRRAVKHLETLLMR